jgi:hypothetical protein
LHGLVLYVEWANSSGLLSLASNWYPAILQLGGLKMRLTGYRVYFGIYPMEDSAMKKILFGMFALWLMSAGVSQAQTEMVRLYIAPNSTVAAPDIMKNLVSECPNTTITIDPKKSDFMLQAWGWSGNYKFTLFQRGGTAVYATTTVRLSSAVKDVCHFVKSPQAHLNTTYAPPPSTNPPPSS